MWLKAELAKNECFPHLRSLTEHISCHILISCPFWQCTLLYNLFLFCLFYFGIKIESQTFPFKFA
jgi:hypothetical protein